MSMGPSSTKKDAPIVLVKGLKWIQGALDIVWKNVWTLSEQNLLILMILLWDLLEK